MVSQGIQIKGVKYQAVSDFTSSPIEIITLWNTDNFLVPVIKALIQIRITVFGFNTNVLSLFVNRGDFLKKCQVVMKYTNKKVTSI